MELGGKMKKLLLLTSLALSTSLLAQSNIPADQMIGDIVIEEVSAQTLKALPNINNGGFSGGDPVPAPVPKPTFDENVQRTGKVISMARDIVALGEAVYELAKKGRPTNVTEYAPISVVPRDPMSKEYVDPFELEGFSVPVEKSFVARIKDGAGKESVTFNYKVIYSYGGSLNGTGKYLTNVIIVPGSIVTRYGWDFNASMKLSGVMNHGTKADPVAGVMVTIKYQMNSWSASFERNDTLHITGRGEFKSFASK